MRWSEYLAYIIVTFIFSKNVCTYKIEGVIVKNDTAYVTTLLLAHSFQCMMGFFNRYVIQFFTLGGGVGKRLVLFFQKVFKVLPQKKEYGVNELL